MPQYKYKIQINYDLKSPGGNYEAVEEYIKAFDRWDHLLKSCWVVKTSKTPGQVRDELMKIVRSGDLVAVFDVTNSAWATNFSDKRTDWLKKAA